ncbi:hypothetical protein cyc_01543 [Cyclospora cayetanensis]|uniref:Uncharacterized protein n=1 Tax=Cyclospora cayetanensis TaxID=88456 RepID=A0A1D3D5Z1_9EIME|nr:hypothetical protein cyc_01543 [Cyclospora cayetanensis]
MEGIPSPASEVAGQQLPGPRGSPQACWGFNGVTSLMGRAQALPGTPSQTPPLPRGPQALLPSAAGVTAQVAAAAARLSIASAALQSAAAERAGLHHACPGFPPSAPGRPWNRGPLGAQRAVGAPLGLVSPLYTASTDVSLGLRGPNAALPFLGGSLAAGAPRGPQTGAKWTCFPPPGAPLGVPPTEAPLPFSRGAFVSNRDVQTHQVAPPALPPSRESTTGASSASIETAGSAAEAQAVTEAVSGSRGNLDSGRVEQLLRCLSRGLEPSCLPAEAPYDVSVGRAFMGESADAGTAEAPTSKGKFCCAPWGRGPCDVCNSAGGCDGLQREAPHGSCEAPSLRCRHEASMGPYGRRGALSGPPGEGWAAAREALLQVSARVATAPACSPQSLLYGWGSYRKTPGVGLHARGNGGGGPEPEGASALLQRVASMSDALDVVAGEEATKTRLAVSRLGLAGCDAAGATEGTNGATNVAAKSLEELLGSAERESRAFFEECSRCAEAVSLHKAQSAALAVRNGLLKRNGQRQEDRQDAAEGACGSVSASGLAGTGGPEVSGAESASPAPAGSAGGGLGTAAFGDEAAAASSADEEVLGQFTCCIASKLAAEGAAVAEALECIYDSLADCCPVIGSKRGAARGASPATQQVTVVEGGASLPAATLEQEAAAPASPSERPLSLRRRGVRGLHCPLPLIRTIPVFLRGMEQDCQASEPLGDDLGSAEGHLKQASNLAIPTHEISEAPLKPDLSLLAAGAACESEVAEAAAGGTTADQRGLDEVFYAFLANTQAVLLPQCVFSLTPPRSPRHLRRNFGGFGGRVPFKGCPGTAEPHSSSNRKAASVEDKSGGVARRNRVGTSSATSRSVPPGAMGFPPAESLPEAFDRSRTPEGPQAGPPPEALGKLSLSHIATWRQQGPKRSPWLLVKQQPQQQDLQSQHASMPAAQQQHSPVQDGDMLEADGTSAAFTASSPSAAAATEALHRGWECHQVKQRQFAAVASSAALLPPSPEGNERPLGWDVL